MRVCQVGHQREFRLSCRINITVLTATSLFYIVILYSTVILSLQTAFTLKQTIELENENERDAKHDSDPEVSNNPQQSIAGATESQTENTQ